MKTTSFRKCQTGLGPRVLHASNEQDCRAPGHERNWDDVVEEYEETGGAKTKYSALGPDRENCQSLFVCQRILHDVCHIDIGSLVAITDFKEVLMPTLADIIAGDLVLPQGGQGAGQGHHQGEDYHGSPAHSLVNLIVEEHQGGGSSHPGKKR